MKTFHIEISNLGPIKSALFDSAQMNVICGKNNSGKSIFLHTVYCFLAYWRYQIPFKFIQSDEVSMLSVGDATVDYEKYIRLIDQNIKDSMSGFISQLPTLLAKEIDTSETTITFSLDKEYALALFRSMSLDFIFEISKDAAFKVVKSKDTFLVKYSLVNKTGANLDEDSIINAYRYVAAQICHFVLPVPMLLTAERAGSIMYGADVLAHGFQLSQNSIGQQTTMPHRYPYALIQEIQFLQNVKRGQFESIASVSDGVERGLVDEFGKKVAKGSFVVEDGRIFYHSTDMQSKTLIDVEAASTSVKALVGLHYFLKSMRSLASLLMIDEPELNLHPARQRELIRFLAKLINVGGIGVAISTHSPTIVRELNTLIALWEHKEQCEDVIRDFKYTTEELLSKDSVACGVVEGGGICQVKNADLADGFFVKSFDDTADQISNIQSAIVEKWDE